MRAGVDGKPGGCARYVYRDEMFPSVVFRRAYDSIQTPHHGVKGDLEYLRILHLAANTLGADVEAALVLLLADRKPITDEAVKLLVKANATIEVPDLVAGNVASRGQVLIGVHRTLASREPDPATCRQAARERNPPRQ